MRPVPLRALGAELIGTALLLWAIVGSGIVVAGDGPLLGQLVPHAIAVGIALVALIALIARLSGAHFNPVVTMAAVALGHLPRSHGPSYVAAQLVGAVLGTLLANLAAGLPAVTVSARARDGATLVVSEVVATLVLVLLIVLMVRAGRSVGAIAAAVGAYIGAAIVFTPSTSFANPAVTVARTLSDTFTGIAPASVTGFIVAQLVGGMLAVVAVRALTRRPSIAGGAGGEDSADAVSGR